MKKMLLLISLITIAVEGFSQQQVVWIIAPNEDFVNNTYELIPRVELPEPIPNGTIIQFVAHYDCKAGQGLQFQDSYGHIVNIPMYKNVDQPLDDKDIQSGQHVVVIMNNGRAQLISPINTKP